MKGELYTGDDRGYPPKHPTPQTVWYDPAEPSTALLSGPTRMIEGAVFFGLPVAAVLSFGVGVTRGIARRKHMGYIT